MTSGVTGPPELYVWARFGYAPDDQAVHQALCPGTPTRS